MAYDKNQNQSPVPLSSNESRKSVDLLPKYFRTEANKKILSSTLDQMLQPGVAEKVEGYFGRKTAKSFRPSDTYVEDVSTQREIRQLEPAAVVTDDLGNVEFYKDYTDYVNQIKNFNGTTSNHSLLNSQEYYAWNPNVDWDKLVNFREYYWLPYGPQTVNVFGQSQEVQSTYTVTAEVQDDNTVYLFSPPGFTPNPSLTLYRGQKYIFEINTPGHPFSFSTNLNFANTPFELTQTENGGFWLVGTIGGGENESSIYVENMRAYDIDGNEIPPANIEEGTLEFTVPFEAPERLYYASQNSINTSGLVKVFDIEENTKIDVTEILGKKTYKSANGVEFTNGLKVDFLGTVVPEQYAEGAWYVEGVGDKIKLIKEENLIIPAVYVSDVPVPFDDEGFDRFPFENANSYAGQKDYIVVNRASADRNSWSRHNRWFHRDVIEQSAAYNDEPAVIDQTFRASRPIIEFEAGLKLYNYGTFAKNDIDLVDTITTDVFSNIEGSAGYNVDGVDLAQGMRVLFTADDDILVSGKIYTVNFIQIQDKGRIISLLETEDTQPLENETVLVTNGEQYRGTTWFYNGTQWRQGQSKTDVNQQPMFDLFDGNGISLGDINTYPSSNFRGNKVFSYVQNDQEADDAELGFGLTYRSIENLGDIIFNFDLVTESYTYQANNTLETINSKKAYLKRFTSLNNFVNQNGWSKGRRLSQQAVIRQYIAGDQLNNFAVDVFDNSGNLSDLVVKVILNNDIKKENVHYVKDIINSIVYIRFNEDLNVDDVVQLKCYSSANANENGYYELAHNLERNPLNKNVSNFTLGEAIDHVGTIVENLREYNGSKFPGASNLRDLGDVDRFGLRFVKHSGPINLALFHVTDKNANIVKAIRHSRKEYGKFKRLFLQVAETLGYEGPVKEHLDRILAKINSEKNESMPFYFTDMVPISGARRIEHPVRASDTNFYALTEVFNLENLSPKAVLVYLNGTQLVHGRDYTFNDQGFINVTATKTAGDLIEIYEYESTDGCFVPATPTKLGLYPKYEPMMFEDNTYREPLTMIQGHDGSLVRAYGDFRDNLILELEKRIFNNIKQEYRPNILDIHDFLGGEFRDTKFTKNNIDRSHTADFIDWVSIAGNPDYTTTDYYIEGDSFTYNYSSMSSPSGKQLPGWWRQVYKQAYDTDRPHTHPWEMLGFTIMPKWWEEVYGPAPYTRSNTILWEDLEQGVVREPGVPVVRIIKYARPGLLTHIPVDDSGTLLSPLDSNYAKNYVSGPTRDLFVYGDGNPIETAWRKSAEYPFALFTSWILNQPAKVIGIGFDISRIERDLVGNLVSTETNNCITLEDIVFPNTTLDNVRQAASGLVNFVYNYLASSTVTSYENYQRLLTNINNRLSLKVGGFTEQEKFKLILDSRTPLNEGNVFVPTENYKVFLNTSSPVETISYSGVIIEKRSNGYIVRGYDREKATFDYFEAVVQTTDPAFNVGGISESFVEWSERKQYVKAQNVRFNGIFFRVKESHVSTTSFDETKFERLASLPLSGGRTALLRRKFTKRVKTLPYGSLLKTTQDVTDFLIGYEAYLKDSGFKFEYFDQSLGQVSNWQLSVKEFLFWTTQNWSEGSVITLSPSANELEFQREFYVVDDIFDKFYNYSLFKADGKRLDRSFSSIVRDNENVFGIRPKNTEDGIFHLRLPLIQREHAIILDNQTVFGDVIYDQEAGYRQERIKVTGYRSDGWTGGLNIPGFVYDEAIVEDWTPYKDYGIGSLVKYKEYYYVSTSDLTGVEQFNDNDWERLDERPQAKMYPNFDYRINQFADFYDLDSDNFDLEQQRHAQHLIGYQKRQYLQNIINDDVSQYKFYQGMIADKGTINSLTKLFDALSSADKDSVEFYEEWAVRTGQYGATDNFKEVEFIIDEDKIKLDPTPVELVSSIPPNDTDDTFKIIPNDVYFRPKDYDHKPFPITVSPEQGVRLAGYVNDRDVMYRVKVKADLLQSLPGAIGTDEYIWISGTTEDWDVLQHINTDLRVTKVESFASEVDTIDRSSTPGLYVTLDRTPDFQPGDIVGLQNIGQGNSGFYLVQAVRNNVLECFVAEDVTITDSDNLYGYVSVLRSVRAKSVEEANAILEQYKLDDQIIWLDGTNESNWSVLQKQEIFTDNFVIENPVPYTLGDTNFSSGIASSLGNRIVAIGDNDADDGVVNVYSRDSSANDLRFEETIRPQTGSIFVTNVNKASPGVVTSPSHGLVDSDIVRFKDFISLDDAGNNIGMVELDDVEAYIKVLNDDNFEIYIDINLTQPLDTTGFTTFRINSDPIALTGNIFDLKSKFGSDVALSPDGKLMVVGIPGAQNPKTNFKGDFATTGPVDEPDGEYKAGQVIKYNENFWRAVRNVPAENNAVTFSTFDSYAFLESNFGPLPQEIVITFPKRDEGEPTEVSEQIGFFTKGEIVVGETSGATAVITEIETLTNNQGARTGQDLRLGLLTGLFEQGEILLGKDSNATGVAILNLDIKTNQIVLGGKYTILNNDDFDFTNLDSTLEDEDNRKGTVFVADSTTSTEAVNARVRASFDSVQDKGELNVNSRQLTLLLQGHPYLPNTKTDHILVRAPLDQYRATKTQDKIVLKWNEYTSFNREFGENVRKDIFPDNISLNNNGAPDSSGNTYVPPRASFVTGEHEIIHKVDHVLYIESAQIIPEEGDLINCATGAARVVKAFTQFRKLVLYINNVNGSFPLESIVSKEGVDIGEYLQPNYVEDPRLGGFWYINAELDGYQNTNEFAFLSEFGIPGYGLVYKDVLVYDEDTDSYTSSDRYYYNILDSVNAYTNKESGHFQILSHLGDAYDNVSGVRTIRDSRWFVRAPVGFDLQDGDTFKVWINNEPDTRSIDLLDGQLGEQVISKVNTNSENDPEHVVHDVWDGYMDILLTSKQTADIDVPSDEDTSTGDFFEPSVGDFVEDSITGARAQVVHYIKRNIADARIYVKNISIPGTRGFENRNDIRVDFRPYGDGRRKMGQIEKVSIAGANHDVNLGKLIVVAEGATPKFYESAQNPSGQTPEEYFNANPRVFTFDPHPDSYGSTAATKDLNVFAYVNKEYWIYKEKTDEAGANLLASYPSSTNRDWSLVYNLPLQQDYSSGYYNNSGAYAVYTRDANSWQLRGTYGVPVTGFYNNTTVAELGRQVEISQDNDLYRIYVSSKDKVFVLKHGFDADGNQFEFALDIDPRYRGEFDITIPYTRGEIVRDANGDLYESLTFNLGVALTNRNKWTAITEQVQNLYYVPKDSANNLYGDGLFDSVDDVLDFAQDMAVSENGQVLAISLKTNTTSDADNKVAIYRLNETGRYVFSQTLVAPTSGTGWGTSIDLTPDGNDLVVGDPGNDTDGFDTGKVYVYTRTGTSFVLSETISGPVTQLSQKFGTKVSATQDYIGVASYNGDIKLPTTFDSNETVFDREFTGFVKTTTDSGTVSIYQKIKGAYVFSEELEYDNVTDSRFGENLLLNRNHIYVGCPRLASDATNLGQVINYKTPKGTTAWTEIRSPNPIVDTNKIKQVFLYDTTTNNLVQSLDYVDVLQGKIPGPADQEITYKSYIDLAKFNVTSDPRLFSETNNWESEYVGRLWWDISTARFKNHYQGDALEQSTLWHSLVPTYSVDVYEWVESDLLPSEWDVVADTPDGYARGISGQSKYGDDAYSQKLTYDPVSKTFGTKYFYWVRNKFTVPSIETRTISAGEVANLIRDPKGQGYRFAALLSNDRFVIYNCQSLFKDKNIALHVDYFTLPNQEQNIHTQYQIISQGLDTSEPSKDIAQKWIDSLVGYDVQGRHVPDYNLTVREKYGINFQPRQSWFVNKQEALKQVIDRANSVLKENIVVDDFSFNRLTSKEEIPSVFKREYDVVIDTLDDLQFVGTAKARPAQIDLIIKNGTVTRARILDRGKGYKDLNGELKGPTYTVIGKGTGLEIATTISPLDGSVATVEVLNGGENYENDTQVIFRKLRVLVRSDESAEGKWTIYEWNNTEEIWERVRVQSFDTNLYWNYSDWYATGYNQFTTINHLVDYSYQFENVEDRIGDIVKISNIGTGGWLLLEKIADTGSRNYTEDYRTVGRENGTIQISPRLYLVGEGYNGFDASAYDSKFFDAEPTTELRNILDALRYDIFVDNLRKEYNELFFASVRYVLSEQPNVDWVFKTSFVKAKHNVGELREDITFNNDNLPSYNAYIEEVKPYKTNIREYLSAYERTENTNTLVTDFDVPPIYEDGVITPPNLKIRDNQLLGSFGRLSSYPDKNWADNIGYKVTSVDIYDAGSKYTYPPKVIFEGGGGSGAAARAYIGRGRVTKIEVTNPGIGYTSAPRVILEGSQEDGGSVAIASAILGETLTKSLHVAMKFDRTTSTFVYDVLPEEETFVGTAFRLEYNLKFPMDLGSNKIEVFVDGEKQLSSKYTYENFKDTSKSYTRERGRIVFTNPPVLDANIIVKYHKDPKMLDAADRINQLYDPTAGMLGNDLGQLMEGVDYGGVEVRSFDFDTESGWDTDGWFSSPWDTYDNTFEDHVFYADGTTTMIELDSALEEGVVYNVYKNGVRLDDPNYPANPTNPNAIMTSITGDGEQTLVNIAELDIDLNDGDILIIRKVTSEGILEPDADTYDTSLSGGQLNYGGAQGKAAEDIIVDGDLFVTPITSGGPEELVAGQVLDAVDIKVYERVGAGVGTIYSQNYVTDGVTTEYDLGVFPNSDDALLVKVGGSLVSPAQYTVDAKQQTVTFDTAPTSGQYMTLMSFGKGGQNILDIDTYVADGVAISFETSITWTDELQFVTTINGKPHEEEVLRARQSTNNKVEFVFAPTAPPAGTTLEYEIYSNKDQINYSKITRSTFDADGSTQSFTLPVTPLYNKPAGFYTMVGVDNQILSPGYAIEYIIDDPLRREYELEKFQIPISTLEPALLEVYLNNNLLDQGTQYLVNIGNSSVILDPGIIQEGDKLEIFTMNVADYIINGNTLTFRDSYGAPADGSSISIYTFTNHDVNNMQRYSYTAVARSSLTAGTAEFNRYHSIKGGKILLAQPAAAAQYVVTFVNNELLQPNVDYTLSEDGRTLLLENELLDDDKVDLIHFAAPVSTPRIAWRQFKDILNRNTYKRLDNDYGIELAEDLNSYDLRISVVDSSQLPDPDRRNNVPGIIFVDGERIEYFVKDGNLLRQIRRGTLGTGIKDVYPAGTEIEPAGKEKNVPYRDQTLVQNFVATEGQTDFELDFVPNSVNDFEVFAAGTRLRKTSLEKFVIGAELDSPEGDVTLAPEFTLDGSTLVLANAMAAKQKVTIVRRVGQLWGPQGTPIKDLKNDIGNFLRGSISKLPE